ncbi:hypothetical protein Tco_0641733 [Tanacetum coccineum]
MQESGGIASQREMVGRVIEDLKRRFRTHFKQQKKQTKTHLAINGIKKKEGETVRAFISRYTDETTHISTAQEDTKRIAAEKQPRKEGQSPFKDSSTGDKNPKGNNHGRAPSVDPILISVLVYERKVGRVLFLNVELLRHIYDIALFESSERKSEKERRIKIPAILQNAKGVPREERLPVDTRGRQSFRRHEEIHRKTSHTRSTKGWRERDHIPSSLKGVRKRSPNGEKRKRQKAYTLCKHSVTRRWAKLPNHRKVGARPGPRSKKTREAIELEEHKIEYKPRNAIRAQVLVDFLAETQEEDDEIDFQNQEEKGKNLGVEAIY